MVCGCSLEPERTREAKKSCAEEMYGWDKNTKQANQVIACIRLQVGSIGPKWREEPRISPGIILEKLAAVTPFLFLGRMSNKEPLCWKIPKVVHAQITGGRRRATIKTNA